MILGHMHHGQHVCFQYDKVDAQQCTAGQTGFWKAT